MKKKILIISLIVFIVLFIFVFAKINNNYISKISKALANTLDAKYVEFDLDINEKKFIGNMEYNFDDFNFLVNCTQNGSDIKIDISKESSTLSYFVDFLNEWVTVDITNIVEKIIPKEVKEFEINKIFDLAGIDDIVDISDFPQKLSNDFKLKLFDKDFLEDSLGFKEKKKNGYVTYKFKPNTYTFLIEYIDTSDLDENKKKEIKKRLLEHKSDLKSLEFEIAVKINKKNYITELNFEKKYNDENIIFKIDLSKYKK